MTSVIWKTFNQELLGFIKSRVNNSENAEDILQEVFIKIHEKIPSLEDHNKLTSWVYQITRNTIIDFYRKKKIHSSDNPLDESATNAFENDLPNQLNEAASDFTKCLKPFIDQLPEKHKDVLLKTTFENISQKDYALRNNLSYSAAKSRIQRARKELNKRFITCCNVESDKYGNIISSQPKDCAC